MYKIPVIGADPELIFSKKGEFVPANNVLLQGAGGFGLDGHAAIAEIRPGFSEDLIVLMNKIMKTMRMADKKFDLKKKVTKWHAGHFKFDKPIGGHIHISMPGISEKRKLEKIAELFDFFIEDCLEDLIAPYKERFMRIATGYGKKYCDNGSAVEVKDIDRFEYRAPGSWLLCPKVTYVYLFLAKGLVVLSQEGWTMNKFYDENIEARSVKDKTDALKHVAYLIGKTGKEKDLKVGEKIVSEVIDERKGLDWDADIREGWLGE